MCHILAVIWKKDKIIAIFRTVLYAKENRVTRFVNKIKQCKERQIKVWHNISQIDHSTGSFYILVQKSGDAKQMTDNIKNMTTWNTTYT